MKKKKKGPVDGRNQNDRRLGTSEYNLLYLETNCKIPARLYWPWRRSALLG
jgi:hypothetical protein